jgi:hypothetical protein
MIQDVFCSLSGSRFSPKLLIEKTALPIENCIEVGQNHTFGKKLPSEYGIANLVAPKVENLPKDTYPMDWIAKTLLQYHSTMLEEFELWVVITFDGSLNWWITTENMKIFSDLGIVLCLSAYHKEGIEEANMEVAESKG